MNVTNSVSQTSRGLRPASFGSTFYLLIQAGIYAVGFFAPWDRWLHLDSNQSTWLLLASLVGLTGWWSFNTATVLLLVLSIAIAMAAAALRLWSAAVPEPCTTRSSDGSGYRVEAAGPYRFWRHPQSLGTLLLTLSLSILMPPSGACLCLALTVLWQAAWVRSINNGLNEAGADRNATYRQSVPGFIPRGSSKLPDASSIPRHWGRALLNEVFPVGATVSFLVLGWRYNALLVLQGVIVSLGVAFLCQAFVPREVPATPVASSEG